MAVPDKNKQWAKLNTKTYMALIHMLDKEVSFYVRYTNQFPPGSGFCKCYTCGNVLPIKKIQCGHYISRRYFVTRFELDNLRPQCSGCNKWRGGEPVKFRQNLIEEIGDTRVNRIEMLSRLSGERHLPREWLIEQILEYRAKNKGLEKEDKV